MTSRPGSKIDAAMSAKRDGHSQRGRPEYPKLLVLDNELPRPSFLDMSQGARMMNDKKQQKLDEKERKEQDDYLEEALEETFPASDPISPGHVPKKPQDKK